jgi:peptide/nickel transport system substrate-binding protein
MLTDESPRPEAGALTRRAMIARSGITLAALSPTFAALAGCGGSSKTTSTAAKASGSSAPIDKLTWALAKAPSSLDLSKGFSGDTMAATYLMHETLVGYSKDLDLVPLLAEKVDTPTPTTYVYTLRDGVTFHDGTPLTPEDVVYSIKHAAAKDSQLGFYFTLMKKVEKTGPREVTVTLEEPSVVFRFSLVYAPIIPRAFAAAKGEKLGAPGGVNWVATGPFKLKSFDERSLVVVRNDAYWGDKPSVAEVAFSYIADAQTLQLSVRSGQIDGTYTASPSQAGQWEKLPDANFLTAPGMYVWFLAFNTQAAPWKDVHVRRAFAHAFNQDGIIKAVLGGHAGKAKVMVPVTQWGGLAAKDAVTHLYDSLPAYPYDLEKAKAELAQSASPDGFRTSVLVSDAAKYVVEALLAFAGDLKKIGITLDVKSVPAQTWLDNAYAHKDLGLTCMQFGPDYPDPSNYLAISYDSSGAVANGFNLANYKNPEVDKLLAKQATSSDPGERVTALSEVLRQGQVDLPYLTLWWEDVSASLNKRYALAEFTALSAPFTAWASDVTRAA